MESRVAGARGASWPLLVPQLSYCSLQGQRSLAELLCIQTSLMREGGIPVAPWAAETQQGG